MCECTVDERDGGRDGEGRRKEGEERERGIKNYKK